MRGGVPDDALVPGETTSVNYEGNMCTRLCVVWPEQMMRTPSSRSGDKNSPSRTCRSRSRELCRLSWTTGMLASGTASFSGMKVPWSKPRSARLHVSPAEERSSTTRSASRRSVGAG